MPLRSMTGFGQAERKTPSGMFRIEIRGVNNRYLDIQVRSPRSVPSLEQKAKQFLTDNISRGSLTVAITWERNGEETRMTWDRGKVEQYVRILKDVQKAYRLDGSITLDHLLSLSDVIKVEAVECDEETLWRHVKPVLRAAVGDFQKSRATEALFITRNLKKTNDRLSALLRKVREHAPKRLESYASVLRKKVESLAAGSIDEQRLATEVSLMADRLDISEECTRLEAHGAKFGAALQADEPAGKRMTFILQEMNREANTIGAKANDATIAHLSIAMKELIEQMREKAQNIE